MGDTAVNKALPVSWFTMVEMGENNQQQWLMIVADSK